MADNFHLVATVRMLSQPAFDSPILCLTEVATEEGNATFALKNLPFPELESDEKEQLLARYNKLIAGIGVENGKKSVWWYTWTSSRCRYNSRILDDMDALARFENMLDGGIPDGLTLLCPDPHLAQAVKDVAKRHGVRVHRTTADRMEWMKRRVRAGIAPFIHGLKVCIRVSISRRRAGSFDVVLAKARLAHKRSLIVTPIKAMNLLEPKSSGDTFFGSLPQAMENENHSVVIFGVLLDRLPSFEVKGRDELKIPVIPMASFTCKRSLPFAYIKGFLSSISIKRALEDQDTILRQLVQRDIHANRSSIVKHLEDRLHHCQLS